MAKARWSRFPIWVVPRKILRKNSKTKLATPGRIAPASSPLKESTPWLRWMTMTVTMLLKPLKRLKLWRQILVHVEHQFFHLLQLAKLDEDLPDVAKSELKKETQDLIRFIFDHDMFREAMSSLQIGKCILWMLMDINVKFMLSTLVSYFIQSRRKENATR